MSRLQPFGLAIVISAVYNSNASPASGGHELKCVLQVQPHRHLVSPHVTTAPRLATSLASAQNYRLGPPAITVSKPGHIARDCPTAGSKSCYKCGKAGHISRDCDRDN
uniref:CCHC-type domain-containing protein n=1 Tax=Timema bartmani TaxID=61472 RepID=A0A7R9I211_9NEOP|nr:unnamed protein product [Timema bartmani]